MNQPPPNTDIWILAGQSNMAGWGCAENYETPSDNVWLFNFREQWIIAEEPFCLDRYESVEDAYAIMRGESKRNVITPEYRRKRAAEFPVELRRDKCGAGLGLTFGKAIARFTGRPVGLLFCPKGDTRMEEWDEHYEGNPYMRMYSAALRRIRKVNRPVTGVLWYQGESDTYNDQGKLYGARTRTFVAKLRRDLNQPDLPFFYVQVATCVQQTEQELPDWNLVQETQRRLEPDLAPGGMVAAIDLPLYDGIHLATSGLQRLGRRLAKLVRRKLYNDTSVEIGSRPVRVVRDATNPNTVRVHFESVNGRPLPADRVSGFSIFAPDGKTDLACSARVVSLGRTDNPSPYPLPQGESETSSKAANRGSPLPSEREYSAAGSGTSPLPSDGEDKGEGASGVAEILIRTWQPIPNGSVLWYGKGLAPFCNLVDASDMAAPMFGPWEIP